MKFNKKFTIQEKTISEASPTFVIAEAGVNHGGDMIVAKKLVDLAVKAKADAVKFQAFKTENLILKDIQKAFEMPSTYNDSVEILIKPESNPIPIKLPGLYIDVKIP